MGEAAVIVITEHTGSQGSKAAIKGNGADLRGKLVIISYFVCRHLQLSISGLITVSYATAGKF